MPKGSLVNTVELGHQLLVIDLPQPTNNASIQVKFDNGGVEGCDQLKLVGYVFDDVLMAAGAPQNRVYYLSITAQNFEPAQTFQATSAATTAIPTNSIPLILTTQRTHYQYAEPIYVGKFNSTGRVIAINVRISDENGQVDSTLYSGATLIFSAVRCGTYDLTALVPNIKRMMDSVF